jgi:hypothetical protein
MSSNALSRLRRGYGEPGDNAFHLSGTAKDEAKEWGEVSVAEYPVASE